MGRHVDATYLARASFSNKSLTNNIMKTILPICLAVVAMPFVLTGCNKSSDMSTPSDTNTPPAAPAAAAPAPAAAPEATAPAAPAATDTNAPAATPAPAATTTNTGT